jgi:hypothetical protein
MSDETLRQRKAPNEPNGNQTKENAMLPDGSAAKNEKDLIRNDKAHLESFEKAFHSLSADKNSYYLTRIVLIRYLAFIYGKLYTLFYYLVNKIYEKINRFKC